MIAFTVGLAVGVLIGYFFRKLIEEVEHVTKGN